VVGLGAIATAVIINSGDSTSTKATVGPSAPLTSAPSTPQTTAPPSTSHRPSQTPQLPPETVTTVTSPSPLPSLGPTRTPTAAPAPTYAPPSATLNPRTVIYTVTGTKQLLDLVNVVYTDARGYPQTEFNVSLPWSKAIVLNPGVQTESVVATSFYSRLNCAVVNAAGQTVLASTNNGIMATCTR
jgi:Mycobacterium membrane protein